MALERRPLALVLAVTEKAATVEKCARAKGVWVAAVLSPASDRQ